MYFPNKRITIYAGHYGSGKTNLAVNHALALRQSGSRVRVFDLDIVNPYFRTKDSEYLFSQAGIELISPEYANTNIDMPSIPAAAQSFLDDKRGYVIIDLGGDDVGALALGRYSAGIKKEDYDMLLVLNRYRPLARDPNDAVAISQEIEACSRVPFTGIIANHNLGVDTDAETILSSGDYTNEIIRLTSLPLVYTAVLRGLYPAVYGRLDRVEPVDIYGKKYF